MPPSPPLYVVVSGPPASGTSTLAAALSADLGLPLVEKDTVKEALMSVLPVPDIAASNRLSQASVAVLLAIAARSPVGAVVEGNFHRSTSADGLGRLPGTVVEVFCRCDPSVAEERYRARTGARHPGHFDEGRAFADLWHDDVTAPVAGGWPVLEVDTTTAVSLPSILAFIRRAAS